MAATAGTPTILINNFNVFEAIIPITLSGSYSGSAAGDTLDLSGIVPSNSAPIYVDVKELPPAGTATSGIKWDFAPGTSQANGALLAQVSAGFTPAGTVAAPTFTGESYTPAGTNSAPTITTSSGGVTVALGVTAGALSEVTGASGITGVQAPTFTGSAHTLAGTNSAPAFTGTAVAAAAAASLGAVAYSGLNISNLTARVVYKKFQ